MNPPSPGGPVNELHMVPAMTPVLYADFVRRFAWGPEVDAKQEHPLSDILHRFFRTCEGRTLEVTRTRWPGPGKRWAGWDRSAW